MAPDRKYWMTRIMAGPAQGDGQERRKARKSRLVTVIQDVAET